MGQAVVVDEDGDVELRLELHQVVAKGIELGAELLELGIGVRLLEALQEAFGIAVEGLAGQALVVGTAGDIAPRAIKDSGGVGDATFGG